MGKTAMINARIDPKTKKKAVNILHSLGITTTQAISLFFKQIVHHRGIPFELKIPNKITLETHEKAVAGKELHAVSDIEELKTELNS